MFWTSSIKTMIELKLDEEHLVPSRHKIAKTELIENPRWSPQPPS